MRKSGDSIDGKNVRNLNYSAQSSMLDCSANNPNLSVKKQLRLQKMALLGINYRPSKDKKKIFNSKDIIEYFRPTIQQFEITSGRSSGGV